MSEVDPIIHEFLVESFENLEQVDRDLVKLEAEPGDRGRLDRIFRAVHTIKGTCGFLGFERLEGLTHAGESLLARLREGKMEADSATASLLLELMDSVRSILSEIQADGKDEGEPVDELVKRLARATKKKPKRGGNTKPKKSSKPSRKTTSSSEPSPPEGSGPAVPPNGGDSGPGNPSLRGRSLAESFVRVDVKVLDRLMDLVGELVLTRNQLVEQLGAAAAGESGGPIQQLNLLTGELQEGVMQTRMQPVSKVLGKLPRMVRDLAAGCGKQVRLSLEGQETELDRSLIEAIRDPLTHLVRNAVDHGLEQPDEREAAGKPAEGHVWISAYHEAGQVTIEVRDDGRGVDSEAVRRKAVERGLLSPDRAAGLGRDETLGLLFLPGFSTSEEVTNLSGRGVGLDVVRENLSRVNGLADVDSSPGHGTVFRLRIPLTLAIMPALVVLADGERYAIPQVNVLELVHLDLEGSEAKIERVHGAPVYRLRGALLPLVELRGELDLDEAEMTSSATIVVLEAGERQFGLVVDAVADTQEIVVKPLGPLLESISVYAGATVMGDGRVALILDVLGFAQRAHVVADGTDRQPAETARKATASEQADRLLVFTSPDEGRMAVQLDRVIRLERIPSTTVETVGEGRAIQYRGDILPLVWVFDYLPERRKVKRSGLDRDRKELEVLIYSFGDQTVGLVVGPVIDIVEEEISVRRPASREGIVECLVVRGRVAELLDVDHVLTKADLPLAAAKDGQG